MLSEVKETQTEFYDMDLYEIIIPFSEVIKSHHDEEFKKMD